MGSAGSVGIVFQYQSAADTAAAKEIPVDLGVYASGSIPAGPPSLESGGFFDAGVGSGAIHGTFDGPSLNYGVYFPTLGGGSVTLSQDQNGNLSFAGVSVQWGLGGGFSANYSLTKAWTVRDAANYFWGN